MVCGAVEHRQFASAVPADAKDRSCDHLRRPARRAAEQGRDQRSTAQLRGPLHGLAHMNSLLEHRSTPALLAATVNAGRNINRLRFGKMSPSVSPAVGWRHLF
jgi:hypothetical protein